MSLPPLITDTIRVATLEFEDGTSQTTAGGGGGSSAVGALGSIQYSDGAGGLDAEPTQLFWDDTNGWLGIGTDAPSALLTVRNTLGENIACFISTSTVDVGFKIGAVGSGQAGMESFITFTDGTNGDDEIRYKARSTTDQTFYFQDRTGGTDGSQPKVAIGYASSNALTAPEGSLVVLGRIGVGTLAPDYSIHATGTIYSSSGGFRFPDGTTQTTAASVSGTNTGDVTLGTANGLSLVNQVLSLGLSSASTTGALSSTDWSTFNSKVSGSGSSGAVAFWNGTSSITQDASNLFWDDTNNALGIGTGSPDSAYPLTIHDATGNTGFKLSSASTSNTVYALIPWLHGTTTMGQIISILRDTTGNNTAGSFFFDYNANGTGAGTNAHFTIRRSVNIDADSVFTIGPSGNVGVGNFITPSYSFPTAKLHVKHSQTNATVSAANSHLTLENPSSTGQSILAMTFSGTAVGGLRADYVGNLNWHATGSQGHQFYHSLDTNTPALSITSSGILVGGAAGAAASAKLHVIGNSLFPSGTMTIGSSAALSILKFIPSSTAADNYSQIQFASSGGTVTAYAGYVDNSFSDSARRKKFEIGLSAGDAMDWRISEVVKGGLTTNGDFFIDTNTLYVDAGNNRVGIGKSNPSVALDVVGAITASGALTASNFSGTSSGTNTGDVTISTANGLSLVGQALSLALSSTSTTGALSSTDWNTFNGKVGGSGSSGALAFWTGTSTISQDATALFWDNTNNWLGVGTGSPDTLLHVTRAVAGSLAKFHNTAGGGGIELYSAAGGDFTITFSDGVNSTDYITYKGGPSFGDSSFYYENKTGGGDTVHPRVLIGYPSTSTYTQTQLPAGSLAVSGRIGIGTATPTVPLDVVGAIAATGTITGSNLSGTNTGNVTIGTANGLSLVGQALSLALASTSTTGALSSTDWNTFNGKLGGSGSSGAVAFWSGTSTLTQDATHLFWDDTNNRLGIGTASPSHKLVIGADLGTVGLLSTENVIVVGTAGARSAVNVGQDSTHLMQWLWDYNATANNAVGRLNTYGYSNPIAINASKIVLQDASSGRVIIGTATDNGVNTLQVTGTILASSTIAASNFSGSSSGTNTGDLTLAAVGASGNANAASLAGQVLTLQPASASFPGVLTAADWSTFNGKVSGSGSTGGLAYWSSASAISHEATNLFWDSTNDRLGILTGSPLSSLDNRGSLGLKVTSVTGTTHTAGTETILLVNNASGCTVTLPAASTSTNRIYFVKQTGTGLVTIDGNASETIDGLLTYVTTGQYSSVIMVCDGSNWFII